MATRELVDLNGAVVLRRELIADGETDATIRARVKAGDLHRVRHGAYADGELWGSLSPTDQHRLLVRAVLRTAHPSAVASHVSAAVEHGASVWGIDLDTVHLTRLDGKNGRREAGVAQHRGKLDLEDTEVVNGIRVTGVTRAAIEVIAAAAAEPALVTINSLLHSAGLVHEELFEANREHRYWPSTLAAAVILRLCDARIESVGESRTSYLCYTQRLPRPEPQVEIRDEHGWLVGRVDFAWPDAGVFLEFQGREKYLKFRREGESLEDFMMREKRRTELICQLTGWVCIPITWADLQRPAVTAARIRRVIASRRAAGA